MNATKRRSDQTHAEEAAQKTLVTALLQPSAWPWTIDDVQVIETHISFVLLAGEFAIKLKKPLDLGFLDFTSLEKRQHFCHEEIRINRRLAPDHYLRVIAVGGTPEAPRLDDETIPAIEYAVLMRRFPAGKLMDELAERNELPLSAMDALAREIAVFHRNLPASSPASSPPDFSGSFGSVAKPARENFPPVQNQLAEELHEQLTRLQEWTESELERLRAFISQRHEAGYVRECHGDLHLGNIAWFNDRPLVFDAIEFSPELRWIDVCNEIAFLITDLDVRLPLKFGRRFLDRYLEQTGDFQGLRLLRFYCVYRAMVRAKIHAIRASQFENGSKEKITAANKASAYVKHAAKYCEPATSSLKITCGLSASGKSSLAARLVETEGCIRVRSDIERKRMFGLQPDDDATTEPGAGIYARTSSEATYTRLLEIAENLLAAGLPVIVDAAFLKFSQRDRFRKLAEKMDVPFRILHTRADPATLRARLSERRARGEDASDATLAVLEEQLRRAELPQAGKGDAEQEWLEIYDSDKN